MGVANRLDLTLRLVQGAGLVSVPDLARRLGVSEMTVRRDLDALASQGLVRRVRGGAVPALASEDGGGFMAREAWQAATKDRLGAVVAGLVESGSRVLLDAGTTTVHVAAHLVARAPLTVAGAQPSGCGPPGRPARHRAACGRRPVPPGRAFPGRGLLALRTLESLAFDCFVMSIGGVHAEHGWSEFSLDDAAVKQSGARQAARTSPSQTRPSSASARSARLLRSARRDIFVTDEAAADVGTHPNGPQTLDALREAGVETMLA